MLARRSWLDGVTGPSSRIALEPLEWLALEFLCFNMRASDHRECKAMLNTDNPLEWAASLFHAVARNGCGWVARLNGRPAGCMGAFENHPGNWQLFSFGTDSYPRVMVLFKSCMDMIEGYGRAKGMHRLECRSIYDHVLAHACIRIVGLERECLMKQYGRKGEDFILFAKLWPVKEAATDGAAAK